MENRLVRGTKVLWNNKLGEIHEILDFEQIKVKLNEGNIVSVIPSELEVVESSDRVVDLKLVTTENWNEAKRRKEIITPLLVPKRTTDLVSKISHDSGVSMATLYRWISAYEESSMLTSLLPGTRTGGKGKSRIEPETDQIINECIHNVYLKKKKRSIQGTFNEIERLCRNQDIPIPSLSTVRKRILSQSEYKRYSQRHGSKAAQEQFRPKTGKFPNAEWPLQTVQIDHTQLDVFIVEENTLEVIGRPWLSLAIDVCSRLIVGYHLSFDSPSSLSTGICIANSILPKDNLLNKLEISADWPAFGIMDSIHCDNGSDFRSETINRACLQYGIDTDFRPVGKPEYGGHIERLLGTVLKEIHNLDGTTFGKPKYRKNYHSEKEANMTLADLETWLVTFFTKVYHLRKHSALGTSPLNFYKERTLGSDLFPTAGIPRIVKNEKKLYLDFLPSVERSINQYGVVIDKIFYYSDVLRNYINAVEKPFADRKKQVKKKFLFRQDPRDISKIYFYDTTTQVYYDIPYRNLEYPQISKWDLKAIKRFLEKRNEPIDEAAIFRGYNEMRDIESKAKSRKRKTRSYDEPTFDEKIEKSIAEDTLDLGALKIKTFKKNG